MSSYGPFDARIGVLQRSPHFVDLIIRNRPGTSQFRLWGARTLNNAYGNLDDSGVGGTGPTLMMTATSGQRVLSPSVIHRRAGLVEESRKGHTSFQFDITDFLTPVVPPPFGTDEEPLFVRVQEYRVAVPGWLSVPLLAPHNPGTPIMGPILVVPSASQTKSFPVLLSGIAPSETGCMEMYPPNFDETLQIPVPMHVVLPRPVNNLVIRNDADDEDTWLLVSFGIGQHMIAIPGGHGNASALSLDSAAGGISEILLACDNNGVPVGSIGAGPGCPFTITAIVPGWIL